MKSTVSKHNHQFNVGFHFLLLAIAIIKLEDICKAVNNPLPIIENQGNSALNIIDTFVSVMAIGHFIASTHINPLAIALALGNLHQAYAQSPDASTNNVINLDNLAQDAVIVLKGESAIVSSGLGAALRKVHNVSGNSYSSLAITQKTIDSTNATYNKLWDSINVLTSIPAKEQVIVSATNPTLGIQFNSDLNRYLRERISAAGDIDGDGFADFMTVDVYGYAGSSAAYVFFGNDHLQTSESVNISSIAAHQGLMIAGDSNCKIRDTAVLSDLNSDGYADMIFGFVESGYPRIKVVFGGGHVRNYTSTTLRAIDEYICDIRFSLSHNPGVSIQLDHIRLEDLGDVNHDGYADLGIGLPYSETDSLIGAGEVYVVFGSSSFCTSHYIDLDMANSTTAIHFSGYDAGGHTGATLLGADVNGDTVNDIIIASPFADSGEAIDAGSIHIIFGGSQLTLQTRYALSQFSADSGRVIYGEAKYANFGYAVDSIGDFTQDGGHEILIGAPSLNISKVVKAKAYILFSQSLREHESTISLNNTTCLTLTSHTSNDALGYAVAGRIDLPGLPNKGFAISSGITTNKVFYLFGNFSVGDQRYIVSSLPNITVTHTNNSSIQETMHSNASVTHSQILRTATMVQDAKSIDHNENNMHAWQIGAIAGGILASFVSMMMAFCRFKQSRHATRVTDETLESQLDVNKGAEKRLDARSRSNTSYRRKPTDNHKPVSSYALAPHQPTLDGGDNQKQAYALAPVPSHPQNQIHDVQPYALAPNRIQRQDSMTYGLVSASIEQAHHKNAVVGHYVPMSAARDQYQQASSIQARAYELVPGYTDRMPVYREDAGHHMDLFHYVPMPRRPAPKLNQTYQNLALRPH